MQAVLQDRVPAAIAALADLPQPHLRIPHACFQFQDIDGIEAIRNFHSGFPSMKILPVSGYMAGCE
jgi:hypothetical protein